MLAAWIRGLSGEGQSRNFEDGGHGVRRRQNNKITTSTPKSMNKSVLYVGLDVHADSISVATRRSPTRG